MPVIAVALGIGKAAYSIIKSDIARKKAEVKKTEAFNTAQKAFIEDKAAKDVETYLRSTVQSGVVANGMITGTKTAVMLAKSIKPVLKEKDGTLVKTTEMQTVESVSGGEFNIQQIITKYWYVPVLAIGAIFILRKLKA